MTVLVTGATGLVGARLLPRLVEADFHCRALVRAGRELPAGVTRIEGDILDPAALAEAVTSVDAIIHLAATFRTTDDALIWKINFDGTRNLVEAARRYAPEARFVMASTSLVYAADAPRPAREDDPVAPTLAYPASKVAAEKLVRESGLNWSILRFGFVYGDGDGHLASLSDLAPRFGLHPADKYSVIHHRDIARFMKMALAGTLDGRIINTTDDAPMSIYELCEIAGSPIAPSAAPVDKPWQGQMDGALARSLGFRPAVPTVRQAAIEGAL